MELDLMGGGWVAFIPLAYSPARIRPGHPGWIFLPTVGGKDPLDHGSYNWIFLAINCPFLERFYLITGISTSID